MSWSGLYAGEGRDGPVGTGPESSMLVLGPPRSGKTTGLVVPNVLAAPGAVVTTSTKADVLSATAKARGRRGTCWFFDPSGRAEPPAGTAALRWSPLSGCADWDAALSRAHVLARAARPGGGVADASHWVERAQALLAPLLHAAALVGSDMAWVMRWVLGRDVSEALAILGARGGELARDTLSGIAATEERERSGIFSTTASILSPYRSSAALAAACAGEFDPDVFARSCDTVYVCSPADHQEALAPLVVALIDEIRAAVYARAAGQDPVVFALDEVAMIAPLPGLPSMVAEGGGQGLVSLACLQDLSQARARWGTAAEGFLSLFSAKVVLPGIADLATLRLVSALSGEVDVAVISKSRPTGWLSANRGHPTRTTSVRRMLHLPLDRVAAGKVGFAIWIDRAAPPAWVRLTPWHATSPWRELAACEAVPAPSSWAQRTRRWWPSAAMAAGALVMLVALGGRAMLADLVGLARLVAVAAAVVLFLRRHRRRRRRRR